MTPEELQQGIEDASKIFIPERHHWGDLADKIADAIGREKIVRVPKRYGLDDSGQPHYAALGCSWVVPLFEMRKVDESEEKFAVQVQGAIEDIAGYFRHHTKIPVVSIDHTPSIEYGRAFFDWRGPEYPLDVRAVVDLDNGFLRFHVSFLVAKHA